MAENIISVYASKEKLIHKTIEQHSPSGHGQFILPAQIKKINSDQKSRKTVSLSQKTLDLLEWVSHNSGRKEADLFGQWISSALNTLISLTIETPKGESGNVAGFTFKIDNLMEAIMDNNSDNNNSALIEFIKELQTGCLSDEETHKIQETFKELAKLYK